MARNRFKDANAVARSLATLKPDQVPKTRKDLVNYLWFGRERYDCNLVKEGPFYAAVADGQIRATQVRCIDSMTCSEWERAHFYRRVQ